MAYPNYWPVHQPQLGQGSPTESTDCGVRACSMSLDSESRGVIVPSVRRVRNVMNDQDETNYVGWDEVIDELGAPAELRGVQNHDVQAQKDHLKRGSTVIWAVDYGVLRSAEPAKTGSESFNGGHAIMSKGWRLREGRAQTRSYDSLLDGRYRGCPNGPVWIDVASLANASLAIGRAYGWKDRMYGLLITSQADIDNGVVIDPDVQECPVDSLVSLVADLRGFNSDAGEPAIDSIIASLERLVGIAYRSDTDTYVIEDGIGKVE